jgi:cell division protein FtsI/penicillin-binding protein 2
MEAFGFGHRTGVDLAGEATGRLKLPGDGDWYPADLGTNTFGQGIAVTPLQMMMAVSALANDGEMVVPHLVKALIDGGHQYEFHAQYAGAPISPEAAHTISDMLAISLEEEASVALVPGYRVAGKTGTGEIPTEFGYTNAITNTSFVGWGPVDNPRFLVYVWLEEPSASIWGSQTAAPLFSQIVQRLVVLMNLPPDSVRAGLAP